VLDFRGAPPGHFMILHSRRCIFIHIPKTGGTTIENLIWPPPAERTPEHLWMGFTWEFGNRYQTGGLQHLLATQVRDAVGADVFAGCHKFAIVRNPFDRAVSQFAYMRARPDLRAFVGMNENDPFKKYLQLIRKKTHVQWDHQHRFVEDENGAPLVDFIGRFEHFRRDVTRILDALGIGPREIGHALKGNRSHYADYYDDESRAMLADFYARDLAVFGYDFHGATVPPLPITK
jgi:hypothetical protein